MKAFYIFCVVTVAIGFGAILQAVQAPAPAAGGRGQGGQRGAAAPANAAAVTSATPNAGNGTLIGGSILPDNSRLATIEQRNGKWVIVTSKGEIYAHD